MNQFQMHGEMRVLEQLQVKHIQILKWRCQNVNSIIVMWWVNSKLIHVGGEFKYFSTNDMPISIFRYELGNFVHPESSKACSLALYSIFNHFISHYDSIGNELGPNHIRKQREANKRLPKNENSGRSLINNNHRISDGKTLNRNFQRARAEQVHHNPNHRSNPSQNQVLNCEQTAVCDITINNPLQEAFRIIIHPMAEVRFIESIRNGIHVNIESIQPSSIWLSPQSQRNRVSFLCLPGGIVKGSKIQSLLKSFIINEPWKAIFSTSVYLMQTTTWF